MAIKITPKQKKEWIFAYSVLFLPICFHFVFFIYVNVANVALAFQEVDLYGNRTWVGLKNFTTFIDQFFGRGDSVQIALSVKNSFKMWWINFVISNPLYFIFSYYVFRKYPFGKPFGILTMVPSIVSGLVYALSFQKMVETALPDIMVEFFDLKEAFPQLIADERYTFGTGIFYSIWLSFGYSVLIYSNAMNGIDDEIFESARLDGVNDRQEFFSIVLPIIWPTVSTFLTTGVASMFTVSGPWLVFFEWSAPPSVWGFSYYMSRTIKTQMASPVDYPMVAASGYVVSLVSLPLVFFTRWLTNKVDKNEY